MENKDKVWQAALHSLPLSSTPQINISPGNSSGSASSAPQALPSEPKGEQKDLNLDVQVKELSSTDHTNHEIGAGVDYAKRIKVADKKDVLRRTSEPSRSVLGSENASSGFRHHSLDTQIEVVRENRKRCRIPSGGQFTLTNLAPGICQEDLMKSFEGSGIPSEALADICVRRNPFNTTATIHVAPGYSALDVEQQFRGHPPNDSRNHLPQQLDSPGSSVLRRGVEAKNQISLFPNPAESRISDDPILIDLTMDAPAVIDLTIDDGHENNLPKALTDPSAEPQAYPVDAEPFSLPVSAELATYYPESATGVEPINLSSGTRTSPGFSNKDLPVSQANDAEDAENSTNSLADAGLNTEVDPISPALSYLTLADEAIDEAQPERSKSRASAGDQHPSYLDDINDSDDYGNATESSSDGDVENEVYVVPSAGGIFEEDNLSHLLHGNIEKVKDHVSKMSNASHPTTFGHAPEDHHRLSSESSEVGVVNPTKVVPSQRAVLRRPAPRPPPAHASSSSTTNDDLPFSVNIPKAYFHKARRLLVPFANNLPLTTVGMRGDIQFIHQTTRRHVTALSLPAGNYHPDVESEPKRHVVDACFLNDSTVVVGHDEGPAQVSCVNLSAKRPYRIDLDHRGHTTVMEYKNKGTSSPNPGISAMATVPSKRSWRFLTGGRDGTVRMWTVAQGRDLEASSTRLPLSPDNPLGCLAYRASDDYIYMCHGRDIRSAHVETPKPPPPMLLSARVQQIHVHPQNPHVVILEVNHLDRQIQVYDTRRSNFNQPALMEFGYRDPSLKFSSYRKGSTTHALFARGYEDGSICLWDYRNTANVVSKRRARKDAIVHTVLSKNQIIAYGSYIVTFWDVNDF